MSGATVFTTLLDVYGQFLGISFTFSEALHAQRQRFNPFDRQANAILPSAEVIQDSVSFWTRVRRYETNLFFFIFRMR